MQGVGFRALFLLLFAVSGFAGLIYESIWSHYLKLFLGHAAYAQTLVLAIFMGGMALGSWITSRATQRWSNLILAYALVEGVIGLLGVLFHGVFVGAVEFAHESALPALHSALLASVFKWSLATLLILPQSILLGMTFPLMSAGLIRRFPATPGATLAMLYFTNSIGAAVGVLVSGFVLIDAVGLPGTILTAGLINIALAIVVWALIKRQPAEIRPPEPAAAGKAGTTSWYPLLLTVALVTGLSSFMYEIGWIRMLSLVLGASTHSFELMLSAFILGLALGGLWIRKRIDATGAPERFLAIVQIAMGGFALLSVPLYNQTFEIMQWLLHTVQRNDGGYQLFNLTGHAIAMAVMLPATFCAGMTLPLITYVLLRRGQGEKSIGAVYAANTAGAIAGIFLAVHLGMPLLGLKGLIVFAAALDIALGVILLAWLARGAASATAHRNVLAWAAAAAAAVVGTLLFTGIDPLKASSGVYRQGILATRGSDYSVRYYQDGKTASVSVLFNAATSQLSIRTNGKSDAAVQTDPGRAPSGDESTMVLTAALPMLYHPGAREVAVIGFGSGLTTNTFLANPSIARVDTIEIEPAMVEGARLFRPRNERAYTDPRSHIHIEDAKTFFSTRNRRYDIIASEPSNPWVSGVASLFTDEFYRHVRRHLRDNGVFVQWIQTYEIDAELVASVVKALSRHFPDYTLYSSYADLIVVARRDGRLDEPDMKNVVAYGLASDLERISIRSDQDLWMRRVGSRPTLEPLFAAWPVPANSDYFPILDQRAARSRFLLHSADELAALANNSLPLLEMLGEPPLARRQTQVTPHDGSKRAQATAVAAALLARIETGQAGPRDSVLNAELRRYLDYLRVAGGNCRLVAGSPQWEEVLFDLATLINPNLTTPETTRFWASTGLERCAGQMTPDQRAWFALYKTIGARNAKTMARLATDLLNSPTAHTPRQREYLFSAGVLGYLADNNESAAYALWRQHAGTVIGNRPPPVSLRLLETHGRQRAARVATGEGRSPATISARIPATTPR